MNVTPIQSETRTIHRGEIKNAPYNPRRISAEGRKKLKESLSEFGLVSTLPWNELTGNLVGGHRRLEEIDTLSETGADYYLIVSVVRLDPDREKALNVVLNSAAVGGEFDDTLLKKLLAEIEGKLSFNLTDLISSQKKKSEAKLKKLAILPPPKLAWVLVGIPMVRFGEISPLVEELSRVPEILLETTHGNETHVEGKNGQP